MAGAKERVGRALTVTAAWTIGVLAFEHMIWPAMVGNDNLETTLANRVDSVAVGQPFNHDDAKNPRGGLHIETIKNPNQSGIEAGWYNAYENSGASDPTDPSQRLRAAVACATLVINGGQLSGAERDAWETAQRNNGQNGDHALAERQFTAAANDCQQGVFDLMGGKHPVTEIAIPIAN